MFVWFYFCFVNILTLFSPKSNAFPIFFLNFKKARKIKVFRAFHDYFHIKISAFFKNHKIPHNPNFFDFVYFMLLLWFCAYCTLSIYNHSFYWLFCTFFCFFVTFCKNMNFFISKLFNSNRKSLLSIWIYLWFCT